jgi:hypothetical protein
MTGLLPLRDVGESWFAPAIVTNQALRVFPAADGFVLVSEQKPKDGFDLRDLGHFPVDPPEMFGLHHLGGSFAGRRAGFRYPQRLVPVAVLFHHKDRVPDQFARVCRALLLGLELVGTKQYLKAAKLISGTEYESGPKEREVRVMEWIASRTIF